MNFLFAGFLYRLSTVKTSVRSLINGFVNRQSTCYFPLEISFYFNVHCEQADLYRFFSVFNPYIIFTVRQLEKARAAGNLTIDPSTAAILSTDPSILSDDVLSDNSLKTEEALMTVNQDSVSADTMNDHDYGTVAAKRMKTES